MKLIEFKKNNFLLRISNNEAYSVIRSIASQLDTKDPNIYRTEYYPEGAEYFSISVCFEKDPILKRGKRIEETKARVKDKLRKIKEREEKVDTLVCPVGIRFILDHTEGTCDPVECDWDTVMRNCTEACMVDCNGE